MNRILKAYLKRLTNLSTRNKSLLLPSLPSEQFIDLHNVDYLLGKPSFDLLHQLIQRKVKIALCDFQDPRFERVNEVSKRLRKISRTESFIREERGSRDLYVGYPFVRGKLSDGTPIHAPLLFFPVTLKIEKEQWCLCERDEAGIELNRSFALAYSHFNETSISDEVLEKSFEDFSKDPLEFRTQLYEWLKETPFKINFNQQLFEDKLAGFDARKSSELELSERHGELKLFPEAVLGIFPQAGSFLVPDYNQLLEKWQEKPFEMMLLPNEEVNLESDDDFSLAPPHVKIKEEEILTPFAIDESQESIILSVKSGKSVVVQGPPGSGKSQLICNLMADFASSGKRVLLVCQKRAALDVVYQRLRTIGLDPFVALIHDFKNDRAELYRQFSSQIEKVEAYRQQNYSLDAVFLERQFTQESRLIDKTVEELNDFRTALFDENESGISVKELYLTSDPTASYFECKEYFRSFRMDQLESYRRKLLIYSKYFLLFGNPYIWNPRKSFASFELADFRKIEKILSEWPLTYGKQIRKFEEVTGMPFVKSLESNRAEILERLDDINELVQDEVTLNLFKAYLQSDFNAHERLAFVRQVSDTLDGFIQEDGIEYSLKTVDLSAFRIRLKKVIDAKRSTVSGIWWDLFGSEKKIISEVAAENNLTTSAEHLQKLDLKVRNRMELESWLLHPGLLYEQEYLGSPDDSGEQYSEFFRQAEFASDALVRTKLPLWSNVLAHVALNSDSLELFGFKISQIIEWIKVWEQIEFLMSVFFLPEQIKKLLESPDEYSNELLKVLRNDFDSLVDMDRIWEEMNASEKSVTSLVLAKSAEKGVSNVNEMANIFENSIRLAWIEYIENKFPSLRAVTSLKMQQWEEQLQGSIVSKQKLSSEISGIKLRELTYKNIENNRLGNRITYRELNHQVTKKRKIWPIRKLLENYRDEVFSLVPCWMASPESVSAIFPMEAEMFDLVIFDEASQCYSEYGLPAAFRGKQIVVTGDSKQLSPSDLYKIRYEEKSEEEEYTAALEIESLLDLAAQSLDQYQLNGHYRSLSLDLIDFSNQHFYKNTLRLLPDFEKINDNQPGISYQKVDGLWKNNANLVEVECVVALLAELQNQDLSVGVVTFNFYQQQAIQEALEKKQLNVKDLFVKNIENVQGDERDIIIFSMGYAPDENGRLSMQFGSLNAQGGENRLNVAITRARERIYFITSLWPSQLGTDNSANSGPKLLKSYMQYALDVSEGKYQAKPVTTSQFRTDWLLKDKLVQTSIDLKKELPFSDLTVKEKEVYKGLVLTDDDLYYHSKSSKEPHAYLPLLLQKKHWPYRRVYSRQHWAKSIKM